MAAVQQLTAEVTLSSGATQDVTASATYESTDTAVATVTAAGLVTAVAVGTATVDVTYQGLSATCAVTVTDPATAMSVTPSSAALELEA